MSPPRAARLNVRPVFKRIDTCAGEFTAKTPYMYSTYEAPSFGTPDCECEPSDATKVVILGGGPNRIGQGIEFDYCCCHACFALNDAGYETIMINCNPETVSTDYDTSDRLYFEPLTAEDVLEVLHKEMQAGKLAGVIVQLGGQTPLKLAAALEAAGIPILGTAPDNIDLAEDRERFAALIEQLGLKQPENGIARSRDEAVAVATRIGYPVLMRPSYVLGGRAMEIVDTQAQLDTYIREAVIVSGDSPVLIDRYLRDAIEVDVDAVADGETVYVAGVLQHIEEAGVHSGDCACSLPPYSLSADIIAEIERQTRGAGPRAQRPRADEHPVRGQGWRGLPDRGQPARQPHRAVHRQGDRHPGRQDRQPRHGRRKAERVSICRPRNTGKHIAVKEAVFPFARFPGVDPVLGPEMKSTGEVMGIDGDFATAFAKAQLGAGTVLPEVGRVFVSVKDSDKPQIVPAMRDLAGHGLHHHRHRRHGTGADRSRAAGDAGQQGCRRPAAYCRSHQGWRYRVDLQHHRRRAVAEGQRFDPRIGALWAGALFYHGGSFDRFGGGNCCIAATHA